MIPHEGEKYNHITVIKKVGRNRYLMQCDCGNTYERTCTNSDCLNTCKKCQTYENRGKHHDYKTKLYGHWITMRHRCNNPKATGYKYYGGKGIKVCDEWNDYSKFKEWALANGYKDGLTIERKDSNKDYCPENCCWIPQALQQKTSSNSKLITIGDKTMNITDWCTELNISTASVRCACRTHGFTPQSYIEYKLKFKAVSYLGNAERELLMKIYSQML